MDPKTLMMMTNLVREAVMVMAGVAGLIAVLPPAMEIVREKNSR